MLHYCVDVFMGTCKIFITLFLCLDGWYFTIFMFCFYRFFYINVIVLSMLAASIDGFLLFWQPSCYELTSVLFLCFFVLYRYCSSQINFSFFFLDVNIVRYPIQSQRAWPFRWHYLAVRFTLNPTLKDCGWFLLFELKHVPLRRSIRD